jgi:hypothetical protein
MSLACCENRLGKDQSFIENTAGTAGCGRDISIRCDSSIQTFKVNSYVLNPEPKQGKSTQPSQHGFVPPGHEFHMLQS